MPFRGGRSSADQPHWLFPVSGLANLLTGQLLLHLVHQQLLRSKWFWLSTVLDQFPMTEICQFFRAPNPGCFRPLALKCQLWGWSVLYSWSAWCQANCEAEACQFEWESPRGSKRGHSLLLFLVPPTSLYCAQDGTQHIWPCILLRPHCCVSECTRALVICAMVSAYCLHNLHLGSCTVW